MASNIDQDQDQERSIQFILEAFETYIIGCLKGDCVKVILDYKELSHDQKSKLISYDGHEMPEKMLLQFFKEIRSLPNNRRRYRALLNAVKGNQKVFSILIGRAIPTGDLGRTVLFKTAAEFCQTLNVEEVLPSLLAKEVITDRDCQTIRARHKNEGNWKAAIKLLDCLPSKHPYWFEQLLEALKESKHRHSAELLTSKYEELKGRDSPFGVDKKLHSLQLVQSGTTDVVGNEEIYGRDRPIRADREYCSLDSVYSRPRSEVAVVRGSQSQTAMPVARLEKQLGRMQIQKNKTETSRRYNTIDAIHMKNKKTEFEQKSKQTGCGENTIKYTSLPTTIYARNNSSPSKTRTEQPSKTKEWLIQQNIGESWWPVFHGEIEKSYFQELWKFVEKDRRLHGPAVSPRSEKVFCWTKYCRLDEVKVVIIAENPTSGHDGANGLAFGVKRGHSIPRYLNNIYQELKNDMQGFVAPKHGNLKGWAHQGVLLLNSVLTWRGEDLGGGKVKVRNVHQDRGWEVFTDEILSYLNLHSKHPLVFMLWGKKAQEKGSLINGKIHWVLEAPHPSPLSAWRGFFGCKHFSKCNDILVRQGKKPIDWSFLPESLTASR